MGEREAAAFLPDREQLLGAILDHTNLTIYLKDRAGKYLYVNRQYERLSGVPASLILGKHDEDLFPAEVARLFREQDAEVVARRQQLEFEETIPLPGGLYSFITAKFPLIDAAGWVYAVGGVCTDITCRAHLSEETLAAERERLAITLRSLGEAVISTDLCGNVALMNPAAEQLTGWRQEDALGQPVGKVLPAVGGPPDAPVALDERPLLAPDGVQRVISGAGAPVRDRTGRQIGAVLCFRDVTEEQRMKEELFRVRKLDALGVLAGGIAHDFNNLLVGVLGNLSLAVSELPPDHPSRRMLAGAERAAVRARGLTQQLLTFAKGGDPVREVSSLGELLRETGAFCLCGSNVTCTIEVAPDLWPASVDRAQLGQVVQNLALNAVQAMPAGGSLRMRCDNVDGGADGRWVELTVEDDGPGIPEDILDRIFEPYFTTKEGGTGLGLSIAYSVVRKHGGHITARNRDGGGACFTIRLPAAGAEAAPARRSSVPAQPTGGRILLMDDDSDVRDVTAEMLRCLGFEVTCAADGREAIALHRSAGPFDLLILDLTVRGGMGGAAAIQEIQASDPGVRAVVSSGYADAPFLAAHRAHGFVSAVMKPYTLDELRDKILAALGSDS